MTPVLPNFLIVGAAKAGTTSLYCWLRQHPNVFLPSVKEPCYFVDDWGFRDLGEYLSLFEGGRGRAAIGEASASYLAAPESPRRIHEALGDAKILILLRNPVARAFSLYKWMVMEGYEPLSTFERALEAEPHRLQDVAWRRRSPQYFWDYAYFTSGLYCEQVKRYLETFSRVEVLLFDDLIQKPLATFERVCRFLDVRTDENVRLRAENVSRFPRFVRAQNALRAAAGAGRGRLLQRRMCAWAMGLNLHFGVSPALSEATAGQLRDAYRRDVEGLATLISDDLTGWLGSCGDG